MSDKHDPERKALVSAATATEVEEWHSPQASDFDLAEFDWVPVHRRPRADGWTIDRQRRFIETLADTGSVTQAAQEVNMSTVSAYRLRNAPDGRAFATAWDIAVQAASRRLIDLAMDRAVNGSEEPVFDRDGNRVGRRIRYNDRLLMFMLRALQPERFRNAHRAELAPGERLPAEAPPIADALTLLAPPTPKQPEALMSPDGLAVALQTAELLGGKLPPWQRDRDESQAERAESADEGSLGAEFEDLLELAKQAASSNLQRHSDDE